MVTLNIDAEELRPLIREVVREVLAELRDESDARLLTEAQAADFLELPRHQLRDARLRGEVESRRVGRRVMYSESDLRAIGRQARDAAARDGE